MAAPNRSAPREQQAASLAPQLARKKLLIESLLIALRASEIARVIDVGTLEYFLDSAYEDMIHGNVLHLSKLWSVLIAEPGIEPRMIFPPLLACKAWERQLGVQVTLPQQMLALSAEDRRAHEARCPIKVADLERLLATRRVVQPKAPTAAPPEVTPDAPAAPKGRSGLVPRSVLAGVGATLLLVCGGWAWWSLRTRSPEPMSLGELSSVLSLKDGRRSVSAMRAVIADPEFAVQTPEERRSRVEAVFAKAKLLGIRSMFLYDGKGLLRASAVEGTPSDRIAVVP